MEYVVFTDESYSTGQRYRSIGTFSFPVVHRRGMDGELRVLLADSRVEEFKWQKLKTAKYRFCAEKILEFILVNLFPRALRIDVLTWDTRDSRHSIQSRNDIANFERMFFHLLKSLMRKREKAASWYIYPDERLEIDWQTVSDCLNHVGKWRELSSSPLFGDVFSRQNFYIKEFKDIKSIENPCCQISDLFAGLSVFSINNYSKYKDWLLENSDQQQIFQTTETCHFSNSESCRFTILNKFNRNCKSKRLGVSLDTKARLDTPNPSNPINFWFYEPQHSKDKAPIREK